MICPFTVASSSSSAAGSSTDKLAEGGFIGEERRNLRY